MLAKGVDSLYLYLSEGLNFSKLTSIAETLRIGEKVNISGIDFERDRAYARAYSVSLRNSFYLFYLNSASIYIKVAALAFEIMGFAGTIGKLNYILNTLNHRIKTWDKYLKVSRIDVYADFAYSEDFDDKRFKTKLRRRGIFISGNNAEGKTYYFGDRSRFCIRLYVKSTEIEVSGKTYLRPIWQARGYDPEHELVWRLEFEYRRKKLDRLFDDISLQTIGGHSQELWSYGIDKLTYMQKEASHQNLYRQDIHPLWYQLRETLFKDYNVSPEEVKAADIEYRRKRAITWLCSHAVAMGETYEAFPQKLKDRFNITEEIYQQALQNYRVHWSE